jgi:hypothetical protein
MPGKRLIFQQKKNALGRSCGRRAVGSAPRPLKLQQKNHVTFYKKCYMGKRKSLFYYTMYCPVCKVAGEIDLDSRNRLYFTDFTYTIGQDTPWETSILFPLSAETPLTLYRFEFKLRSK